MEAAREDDVERLSSLALESLRLRAVAAGDARSAFQSRADIARHVIQRAI